MVRPRDAERTQTQIFRAARAEFAAKGFAGARVAAIARAAGVNKAMLYHYFGDKAGLFRAILRDRITTRTGAIAALPPNLADALPLLFARSCDDRDWIRFHQWEALAPGDELIAERERRAAWQAAIDRLRVGRRHGVIPPDLDAGCLALALVALTAFPLAFPQLVRLAVGRRSGDRAFQRRYTAFLRRVGTRLMRTVPDREEARS